MSATGIKAAAVSRSELFHLAPDSLAIKDGWNARDPREPNNATHIDELAKSIAEIGVKEPLTGVWEDGKFFITNGHMRYFAIQKAIKAGAEIKSVPAKTESRAASEADRVLTQIVSNSGKPLEPLEMAEVFKRLVDFGWKETDIAAKVGKTKNYVADLLRLRASGDEVTAPVRAGKVSATLAAQTLRKVKGDGKKAAAQIKAGVKSAAKKGKKKATAKDIGQKSVKTEMKEIFGRATPGMPGTNTVTFMSADMIRVKELFKLTW